MVLYLDYQRELADCQAKLAQAEHWMRQAQEVHPNIDLDIEQLGVPSGETK